jgi:hypothetical protein
VDGVIYGTIYIYIYTPYAILYIIISYLLYLCYLTFVILGRARGWTAGVRFATGARDFSVLHSVQTGSGARPTSHPMGAELFPWG